MDLVGRRCMFTLGEPWDFPHNPFEAILELSFLQTIGKQKTEISREELLIRATKPFVHENLKSEYFRMAPRYGGEGLSQLGEAGELIITLTRITELRAKSENPFTEKMIPGDEKWRGGIGSAKLCT